MRQAIGGIALSLCVTLALVLLLKPAQAQTYSVLHYFTGNQDGAGPSGLTMDRSGNLYGAAVGGGEGSCTSDLGETGCGTVYELQNDHGVWTLSLIYSFLGAPDGAQPYLGFPTVASDGTLYGTTIAGGNNACMGPYRVPGCGTVFHLTPRADICPSVFCPWNETQLYAFTGGMDGSSPLGSPIFDGSDVLYGTTLGGNSLPCGSVYKFTSSAGMWTFDGSIYNFSCAPDGNGPNAQLLLSGGNLYGTTSGGGAQNFGTVYELAPSGTERVIYSFTGGSDGDTPIGGLIADSAGNLYGSTTEGGSGGGGTIFELSPSGGRWSFTLLASLVNGFGGSECGVWNNLAMDSAGNLYGTTACNGAFNFGSVFKLTPTSQPPWTYTSLHDFCAGGGLCSDGEIPTSNVVLDSSGNLYGTAYEGGRAGMNCTSNGCGVVWKIVP